MKRFQRVTLLLVFVLTLSFVSMSFAAEEKKKEAPKKLKVGDMISDFTLKDGLTKSDISFERDIKGKSKVVIISFMTTACSACKAEMSLLSDLANKYNEDVKTWAVSVDLNGEKTIPSYDSMFGFNVKYLLDPDFSIPQRFGFTYTPSLVVANKEGKILYLKGGYSPSSDPDTIIQAVKDALK